MSNFCERYVLLQNFIANVNNVRNMISYSDAHFSPIERAVLDWCLSQVPDNVVDMSVDDFEVLTRRSHLDATHIGPRDLPYLYRKFGDNWYYHDPMKFDWVKLDCELVNPKEFISINIEQNK